jgi:hypothetical protein
MFAHYVAVALRNIRGAPFASVINLVTLAVGLLCFVTAYAFVNFWGRAERQFRNVDDIYVLTVTIQNRDSSFGNGIQNATRVPDIARDTLQADFPAIAKSARANVLDGER